MLSAPSQLLMRSKDTFAQGKWLLVNPTDSHTLTLRCFTNTLIFISKVVLREIQRNIRSQLFTPLMTNLMVRLFTCLSLKSMRKC